jgi:excisionase family DNA binding protein
MKADRIVLDQYPDLLTVREVATILRVDRSYVYRLIRAGRLPVVRPTPHKTRVVKAELCAFLDATRPVPLPDNTALLE